jgi:dynein heavy chain
MEYEELVGAQAASGAAGPADTMHDLARLHELTDHLMSSLRQPAADTSAQVLMQHFYRPRSGGPHANRRPQALTQLRIPRVLQQFADGGETDPALDGMATARSMNDADLGSPRSRLSYAHVKRWNDMPKGAWLHSAEAGLAPGPVHREMSHLQKPRLFGADALCPAGPDEDVVSVDGGSDALATPRRLASYAPGGGGRQAAAILRDADAAPAASRPQPSVFIGAHYSPCVAGVSSRALETAASAGALPVYDEAEAQQDESDADSPPPDSSPASGILPLHLFDDSDLEASDAARWATLSEYNSLPARSRFWREGDGMTWEPCEVFEHDPTTGLFQVRWAETKNAKWVSRFNLLFDTDDEAAMHARVQAAAALRAQVEAEVRYESFARSEMGRDVPPAGPDAALEEAVLRRLGPVCEASSDRALRTIEWYHAEQRMDFDAAMRRAELGYELRSAKVRSALAPLALRAPVDLVDLPAPELGVLRLWKGATGGSRSLPAPPILDADRHMLRCVAQVHATALWMADTSFWDDLAAISLPCSLQAFSQMQAAHTDTLGPRLRDGWVGECELIFKHECESLPDFTAATVAAGRAPRLLQMLKLRMQDHLQAMLRRSMADLFLAIQAHAPTEAELAATGAEWVHEFPPGSTPLLEVSLVLSDGGIAFDPPLREVTSAVEAVLDGMLAATQGVPAVDGSEIRALAAQGVRLAKPSTLRTLDATGYDAPQHVPHRTSVQETRDALRKLLAACTVRPEQLRQLFARFELLWRTTEEEYLETLAKGTPDFALYRSELHKWRETADAIRAVAPATVHCRLMLVRCESLREALVAKAESLVAAVANVISDELGRRTAALAADGVAISERLQTTSDSAEAVVEMRAFLEGSDERLEAMSSAIDRDLMGLAGVLETFSCALPDATFVRLYSAAALPGRIDAQVDAADEQQVSDVVYFQDQLRNDKQKFEEELEACELEIKALVKLKNMARVEEHAAHVATLADKLAKGKELAQLYVSREELFGWPPTSYPQLDDMSRALEPYLSLWSTARAFSHAYPSWMEGPFVELVPEDVERDVSDWWRALYKLAKQLAGQEGPLQVINHVRGKLDEFKEHLPLITAVLNPGLRDRHWRALSETTGRSLKPTPGVTTLSMMLEEKVDALLPAIQDVSETASKEHSLEKALDKMYAEWRPQVFGTLAYRDTGTHILRGLDDVQGLFDDHIVKTQAMRGSPFVKPFENRVREWEAKLITMQEVIDEWLKCQSVWLYLEPIFSSEDIMRQMPQEAKRFTQVDRLWRKVMEKTVAKPNVLLATAQEGLLASWREANQKLELIQKGLNDYLEAKRLSFARLFFLSNDELLQILSETKDPLRVQPHLKKCFEGIAKLDFDESMLITAMFSVEGERVPLDKPVNPALANGMVEKWLLEVEGAMKQSVSSIMRQSEAAYARSKRVDWCIEWPGMVVLAVDQIYWTREAEELIARKGLQGAREYEAQCTAQLDDIVRLVRSQLTKLQRATLGAMVTMDVHGRDVLTAMVEAGVDKLNDFNWISQLRYYYQPATSPDILVRIISSEAKYGFEYLGNSFRLVVTSLTDRCYRTLMGALQLNLGGAPEGPAGTGKTETTKDLAKALAKQCVVFNCSDGLDYLAMGKFFKGLAAAGAWACFDEFNRIDLEVLSVIAQQILTIQRASTQGLTRFIFEGTDLPLDKSCAVFITMNPGYAGRSELPDNLKALFRPCAMMVPDYAMIGEISLMSYGFSEARPLARKIVQTYTLCSEQLSSQDHYDYGMRAVKSVLTAAGSLKREFPDEDENVLVLRSIKDVNLPKFLSHDIPLFQGITSDLFPGVALPQPNYEEILGAACAASEEFGLQPAPSFLAKVLELHEMILVRHGLMIVGMPFAAKTSAYRVLARALSIMAERGSDGQVKVNTPALNPKSVPIGRLYGEFDPISHEWSDGILAVIFRMCCEDTSGQRFWMIFDGPVDAVWIESMNTVLDDNKKLCLVSGEIIGMTPRMNLIFEPMDLAVASPATVSRCGMVYMEPSQLGWRPLVPSWMSKLPTSMNETDRTVIKDLFEWLLEPCLYFLRKTCRSPVPTQDINMAQGLMRLLDAHLGPWRAAEADPTRPVDPNTSADLLICQFLFAIVWGVGATVDTESRTRFDAFLRTLLRRELPDQLTTPGAPQPVLPPATRPAGSIKPSNLFPEGRTVYDVVVDCSAGAPPWKDWMDTIPSYSVPREAQFHDIFVPTIDSVQVGYLIDTLLGHGVPLLLCGNTGTGKTVLLKDRLLHGLPNEKYQTIMLAFSAQTSATVTQGIIDSQLDKRRKGVFGPPFGKRSLIFIDDLNMPQPEEYGAQPPIELMRQWMDHGGWYDLKELKFREIVDVQFVAAMGPPGGGRNHVTPRYMRHYNQLWLTDCTSASLERIFSTILSWHLAESNGEVKALCNKMVACTVSVYSTISAELLPTPAKSHYTFNLRDVAKVVQGVLQSSPKTVQTTDEMLSLWQHECRRVFADRLVDEKDSAWFVQLLDTQLQSGFRRELSEVTGGRHVLYGDFMRDDSDAYALLPDFDALGVKMSAMLEDYNAVSKRPMSLVLFPFAIEHVVRILRILKSPYGNALLVGVGGSGRQSLTTLAASIAGFTLYRIELSKNYDMNAWREDLRALLRLAGEKGEQTVFLMSDVQIKEEAFVEDLNNLLNAGEVPNLFAGDEVAQICEAITPKIKAVGGTDFSPAAVWRAFIQRCRANLHVVLAMSPIGDAFRNRLRKFPSLVNCCTINWFTAWPQDALKTVAESFFREVEMGEATRAAAVRTCCHFQESVREASQDFYSELRRHNYVTPTSYLELLGAFRSLLEVKRAEVTKAKSRYDVGLEKLRVTSESVAIMQAELVELQPKLVVATQEADELMIRIKRDSADAQQVRERVEVEEAAATIKATEAATIKAECEAGLAEALPALEDSIKALRTLKKDDITEVKGMKSPPGGVKLTLEAVCIMNEIKPEKIAGPDGRGKMDDYWGPAKKMMSDAKFLQNLVEFDKDNIRPEVIEKIRVYVGNPAFEPELIKKASKAAFGLCCWVRAMEVYDRVAKVVQPKKKALAEAEAEFATVSALLKEKKAALAAVEAKITDLQEQFKETNERKENLQAQVEDCSKKLDRAQRLIGGLGGERDRWGASSAALDRLLVNLTGDVLVASGVVSYLGPFTAVFRERIAARWIERCTSLKIKCTSPFSLSRTLGDPVAIRAWNIDGLPNDSFSIDNGIIISHARRWPLMIDPQMQANKWVKNKCAAPKSAGLVTFKLSDGDFVRSLENAVQFGKPALLENVGEELDPVLEPVLLKQVFKSGGVNSLRIGDSTVEYNPDFRFYVTTKLRNPHYLPEVSVKVTLLNFMITPEGLQDQLLGIVVAKEKPELEQEKSALILEAADNKRQLKEIEDKILRVLSESEGNILDDQTAIDVLSSSKVLSDEIAQKQVVAEATAVRLDATREGYTPTALRASILFFCIADIGNVDPMYQYSLQWYIALFERAIDEAEKPQTGLPEVEAREKRLGFLIAQNTLSVYRNVCRSLYEKDKLLFSFLMAASIMRGAGELDDAQWLFFLTGGSGLIPDTAPKNPTAWLAERGWHELIRLSELEGFSDVLHDFGAKSNEWLVTYESASPHSMPLPEPYEERFSPFEKMCLLRCLRPDKVVPMVSQFVERQLGHTFVEPPPFKLEHCYADSSNTSPLVFILSPGQDPMSQLLKFAEARGFGGRRTQAISLGQGQGPLAQRMINDALSSGGWVVLQNCHLATSWMTALEKICEDIRPDRAHHEFRLWLTSSPSKHFPVSVLQNGVKMTNEPPKGLRANMLGSFLSDPISDPAFFDSRSMGDNAAAFTPLVFSLTFFHAVIQERRKFGALGWNIPYEFNESDLRISVRQLRLFLTMFDEVPFEALRYCLGEANYGGRVTDDKDRRCLAALLHDPMSEGALDVGFHFSSDSLYRQPGARTHADYVAAIRELPRQQLPTAFGLHQNADITKDMKETRELFEAVLSGQARSGGGAGGRDDEVLDRIAEGIAAKLPADFDLEVAQVKYPVAYLESMNTVLHQELIRYNRLIAILRSSLASLRKAIKGLVVMSADLESLGTALMQGTRPALWMKRSFPSLKPLGSYVADLLARLAFFQGWLDRGVPTHFWVSGFFFTQAFLTGSSQNYARKKEIPIDHLAFDMFVLPKEHNCTIAPEEGVYVHGLFIEGARYDRSDSALAESEAKVLFTSLPSLWLRPQKAVDIEERPHYMCPLYKTSDRRGTLSTTGHSTNFVMYLKLPSQQPQSHWVKRGVAALCQLDD